MLDNKDGHPEKVRGLTVGLNCEASNQSAHRMTDWKNGIVSVNPP
jgi:hypothetical protein